MDEINTKPLILNDIIDWVDRCAEPTHIYCYHRCVVCHQVWHAPAGETHAAWCWVPRLRAAVSSAERCADCRQPIGPHHHNLLDGKGQYCERCCPLCNPSPYPTRQPYLP